MLPSCVWHCKQTFLFFAASLKTRTSINHFTVLHTLQSWPQSPESGFVVAPDAASHRKTMKTKFCKLCPGSPSSSSDSHNLFLLSQLQLHLLSQSVPLMRLPLQSQMPLSRSSIFFFNLVLSSFERRFCDSQGLSSNQL